MTDAVWIEVSDRLPEEEADVLVADLYGEIGIGYLSDVNDGFWVASGSSASVESDLNEITHWMPLPSAPKP